MRMCLVTLGFCAALSTPAMAGDFTGFYAGVNAGYGFETGKPGLTPGSPPSAGARDLTGARDLPPSALRASEAVQRIMRPVAPLRVN